MTILKKIEAVRTRIRALHEECAALNSQPRTRDDVRKKIIATVNEWHDQARKRHAWHLRQLAHGNHVGLLDLHPAGDTGPTWTLMLGREAVERALLQQIECVPEGTPAQVRAARLAEISSELEAAEAEEEALIMQAEASGQRVWRRADASPTAVLGGSFKRS